MLAFQTLKNLFNYPGKMKIKRISLISSSSFWLWVLLDCATNEAIEGNIKI